MDPVSKMENQVLRPKSKKRKSNRRSSILKSPSRNNALGDLDPNTHMDDNRMSRQSRSRRVSFADTYQILEFAKDVHHRPDTGIPEITGVEKEETGVCVGDTGSHISGLDKLLTGTLCNQLLDNTHEVKELPFPKDPDGSSLLSQSGSTSINSEGVPSFPHGPTVPADQPGAIVNVAAFIKSLRSAADNLEHVSDSPPKKVDVVTFMKTLRELSPVKQPQDDVSEQQFLQSLSRGIYSTSDQGDVSTIINTSLNKYLSSPVSAEKAGQSGTKSVPRQKSSGAPVRGFRTCANSYPSPCHQGAEIAILSKQHAICNTLTGTEETAQKYDIKQFLQKLGGKASIAPGVNYGNSSYSMEFTTHLGTVVESSESASSEEHCPEIRMTSSALSKARGLKVARKHKPVEDKENMYVGEPSGNHTDFTLRFSGLETDAGMEMTSCLNRIVVEKQFLMETTNQRNKFADFTRRFSGHDGDGGMDITTCHGNIVIRNPLLEDSSKHMMPPADVTQRFLGLEDEARMDMTACHGNVIVDRSFQVQKTKHFMKHLGQNDELESNLEAGTTHLGEVMNISDVTKYQIKIPKHGIHHTDVTQRFSGLENDARMEMTACHGNIIVDKCLPEQNTKHTMKSTDMTQRFSGQESDAGMEMTTCIGDMVADKFLPEQNPKHDMKSTDMTQRFSGQEKDAGMEMTTCIGNMVSDKFLPEQNPKHDMKSTDMTQRFSGHESDAGMEMTTCIGNIVADKFLPEQNPKHDMKSTDMTQRFSGQENDAGMEMTTCIGNIVADKFLPEQNPKHDMKSTDMTQRFSGQENDAGMEMTTCIGNIVADKFLPEQNPKHDMKSTDMTQRFSGQENDAGMEMTTCIGNIVADKFLLEQNPRRAVKSTDMTQRFSGQESDAGMEMTTCIGDMVADKFFLEQNPKHSLKHVDMTQRFSGQESDAGMERTTCTGNMVADKFLPEQNPKHAMKSTDVTQRFSGQESDAGMEMTTCIGNMVADKFLPEQNPKHSLKHVMTQRFSGQESDAGMEMATCIGNMVADKFPLEQNPRHGMKSTDVTQRFSGQESDAGMEMTTCIGNMVADKFLPEQNPKHAMKSTDVTQRFSGQESDAGMEMTTCIGNMVADKFLPEQNPKHSLKHVMTQRFSGQESDAGMEMATCIGNMVADKFPLEQNPRHGMKSTDVTQRFSGQESDAGMEMTTCIGNIVADKFLLEQNPRHGMKSTDVTQRFSGQESDAGMEMTICYDNIVVDKFLPEQNPKHAMKSTDVTQRFSGQESDAGMEMTTCIGNMVSDKFLPDKNPKHSMKSTDVTQRFSGHESDAGMEMTTCIGNMAADKFLPDKNPKHSMKSTDVTQRFSGHESDAGMEMTTCIGNMAADKFLPEQNSKHFMKPTDVTQRFSGQESDAGMEMTTCIGNMVAGKFLPEQNPTHTMESIAEMKMTNYRDLSSESPKVCLRGDTNRTLSSKSSCEPNEQDHRCGYSATLDNKFNTVSCVLGKRSLPLGRQSCEPSLYPPEKVQRLMGQTKIPSNLRYLSKKLISLKQDPKHLSLLFGNLKKGEDSISHVPERSVPAFCQNETQINDKTKQVPAHDLDCGTVSARNEDAEKLSMRKIKNNRESPAKNSADENFTVTLDSVNKHDENVVTSATVVSSALHHEAMTTGPDSLGNDCSLFLQHSSRKQSSTDSEEDIMNVSQPELCTLSGPAETTPQKKMPCTEPRLPPFCGLSDQCVTHGQTFEPEDSDGVNVGVDVTPDRAINLLNSSFSEDSEADCLRTGSSHDMSDQPPAPMPETQGSVLRPETCDPPEQTNTVLVSKANSEVVEAVEISKSESDKSMMDVSSLQASQASRTNVSIRRENISCQNLSSFSFLQTEPYLTKPPCNAEQFMQMVCITTCMDWSSTGRRSSFAPPQCLVKDLSLSEILDKVLIDRAETMMLETAVEEMESHRARLLSLMRELEQNIKDNNPDVFQDIIQSKEQCEEVKRQSVSCWSACRKKAKLMGKESKLRWLQGENAALQANKVRMAEALQEVEEKSQSADALLQAVDEALASEEGGEPDGSYKASGEVSEADGSCEATEAGLSEEDKLHDHLKQATKENDEYEAQVATLNRDLTVLTENNEVLNVDMIKLRKELNELTVEEEAADKGIQKLRNEFTAHRCLIEWSVADFCEQSATFLFLYGYIRVVVEFWMDQSPDMATPLIDLITVQSALTDNDRPELVLAHNMVALALTGDVLESYESKKDLPKLLMDISKAVWIGKSLERDLRHVQCTHQIQVSGTSISVYFINVSKIQKCCVRFDFTPSLERLPPATVTVKTLVGDIKQEEIVKAVEGLSTEKNYLRSMVEAVQKVVQGEDVNTLWSTHTYL